MRINPTGNPPALPEDSSSLTVAGLAEPAADGNATRSPSPCPSPQGEGKHSHALVISNARCFVPRWNSSLPLPMGEGRGEGKGTIREPDVMDKSCAREYCAQGCAAS